MELIKTVKSPLKQSLSIYKMSYGDYRVVYSSAKGYKARDFETYVGALKYAKRRGNLIR